MRPKNKNNRKKNEQKSSFSEVNDSVFGTEK